MGSVRIVQVVKAAWCLAIATVVLPAVVVAQPPPRPDTSDDPWVGSWRGMAATAGGETTPVLLTIVNQDGTYRGVVSGFGEGTEVPFSTIVITSEQLVAEAMAESELGDVRVRYELSQGDPGLIGIQRYVLGAQEAEFSVELRRQRRRDIPQPQLEQRLAYFLGRWELEYVGGEFPPLSQGTRSAVITFTQNDASPFVTGQVVGDAWGESYQESVVIGYDDASDVLVFHETLWNEVELLSLGNWQSPIAIDFSTMPVESDGRVYQLKRLFSMTSDRVFMVTEEFSVDGGPYRRLGNGTYTRIP
jgi:hypothetical protein